MSANNFRTAFDFGVKRTTVNWFPKHMSGGLKQMQAKLRSVDCILEVHDARLPLSGRNPDFAHQMIGEKPHILILNKCDLITKYDQRRIMDVYDNTKTADIIFTNCKDSQDRGIKKIVPRIVDMIGQSDRFHRSEMSDLHVMVIGVPNVGKSSFINIIRSKHLKKGRAVKVGPSAGVTKTVHEKVKIYEKPNIYLFDTPGILQPRIADIESGMKLAICGNLPDHQVGERVIADFLLYMLNSLNCLNYVEALGLKEPSDCITTVLAHGAIHLGFMLDIVKTEDNSFVTKPDLEKTALYFITLFRKGEIGKVLLDKLPTSKGKLLYDEMDTSTSNKSGYLDLENENEKENNDTNVNSSTNVQV